MVVNLSIERMKSLGFSEYESRVYCALVRQSPLTAYEAAGEAGVPTSKVYEVLSKLEDKGLVLSHTIDGKKKYLPHPPTALVQRLRSTFMGTLDGLESDLSKLSSGEQVSFLWNLRSTDDLMDQAKSLVSGAQKSILISLWKEDFSTFDQLLNIKHQEGIQIACVHFGKPITTNFRVFPHPIEDTISMEKGGRTLTLVVDGEIALVGTVFGETRAEGAWSSNHGFVTLAEDYIKHDIYVTKIVARFENELIKRFGVGFELLRNIFQDEELL